MILQKNLQLGHSNSLWKNNHSILIFVLKESLELKAELHCIQCYLYACQETVFPMEKAAFFLSSIDIANFRIMIWWEKEAFFS